MKSRHFVLFKLLGGLHVRHEENNLSPQEIQFATQFRQSTLMTNTVTWFGRSFTIQGWNYQASHFRRIKDLPVPKSLRQIEEFKYLLNWLGPQFRNVLR